MAVGAWEIKFSTNYPQLVATAVSKVTENLFGAEYKSVAYLGKQVVNGVNHAVLAEQTILNGKDTKNAVVLVFNEKPGSLDVSLVSINTILNGGAGVGGVEVNVTADLTAEDKAVFAKGKEGYVGASLEPVALLGKQVVRGLNYIFLVEMTPVVMNPVKTYAMVTVNLFENVATITDIKAFDNGMNNGGLGYAFTW
jgi:hypothetical protein